MFLYENYNCAIAFFVLGSLSNLKRHWIPKICFCLTLYLLFFLSSSFNCSINRIGEVSLNSLNGYVYTCLYIWTAVFEQVTKKAVLGIWARRSKLNLVGAHINVFTGEWTQKVTFPLTWWCTCPAALLFIFSMISSCNPPPPPPTSQFKKKKRRERYKWGWETPTTETSPTKHQHCRLLTQTWVTAGAKSIHGQPSYGRGHKISLLI